MLKDKSRKPIKKLSLKPITLKELQAVAGGDRPVFGGDGDDNLNG